MTLQLVRFNTSEGSQLSVADTEGDLATTLIVLSETDADQLTAGQFTVKHNVPRGTEPGTFS